MAKQEQYIYAVTRIRYREMQLLRGGDMEQLLACPDLDAALRFLAERGWSDGNGTVEGLLAEQRRQLWSLLRELVKDMRAFDVFLCLNDFHNLKAAVKQAVFPDDGAHIYMDDCTVPVDLIKRVLANGDYTRLPDGMRDAAREALTVLRETGDGQMCDAIVDRAGLMELCRMGKESGYPLFDTYAQHMTAVANIKTAVRACRMGKPRAFLDKALAPCEYVSADRLADAASRGMDEICACVKSTRYSGAAEALRESPSAFERYCDNQLIELIKPQKSNYFGLEPIAAYLLARENEIKTVRLILYGKRSGIDDSVIRERLRDMYV